MGNRQGRTGSGKHVKQTSPEIDTKCTNDETDDCAEMGSWEMVKWNTW